MFMYTGYVRQGQRTNISKIDLIMFNFIYFYRVIKSYNRLESIICRFALISHVTIRSGSKNEGAYSHPPLLNTLLNEPK